MSPFFMTTVHFDAIALGTVVKASVHATIIKRPIAAVSNVYKTVKLLLAILFSRRAARCVNAVKVMLHVLRVSMSVTGCGCL